MRISAICAAIILSVGGSNPYPPVTPPTPDPAITNAVSLLPLDGINGSTSITDAKGKPWTVGGSAQISTTQSKFGGASLALNGTNSYITSPSHADWAFGTGDFAVKFWVYHTAHSSTASYVSNYSGSTAGISIQWRTDTGKLTLGYGDTQLSSVTWTPVNATWYYIEVARVSGTLYIFVNGTLLLSGANATNLSSTAAMYIGRLGTLNAQYVNGYIDAVQIVKGAGGHTANYTVPTVPFPGQITTYFRLTASALNGGSALSLASLELRTTSGGADIAPGNTFSASSVNTSFPVANAFDSNSATLFKALAGLPQWLKVAMPGTITIEEIGIQAPQSSYGTLSECPKDFLFEISFDDVTYSPLISATGQTDWTYGQFKSYTKSIGVYAPPPPPPPPPDPDPVTPYPSRTRGTTEISVLLHGAVGNGVTNNVAAFNAAIAALPSDGGTILVPDGNYLLDVSATVSVNLRSNMHLKLSDGAKLICKPNALERYYMLRAKLVHDVEISGGEIVGDRTGHTGTTGEWGYGIRIEGATKVTVRDLKVSNCWGDGVILGSSGTTYGDDIWLWNVISDNNRRQGVTVGLAKNWHIEGCTLTNTNGTAPQAGIDVEPDSGPAFNGVITNNTITGNAGAGVLMWQHTSHDIVITGNTVSSNHWGIYGDSVSNIEVSNNICRSNTHEGIRVDKNNNNWVISGNHLGRNSGGADRIPDVVKTGYDATTSTKRDLLIFASSTNISTLTNTFE